MRAGLTRWAWVLIAMPFSVWAEAESARWLMDVSKAQDTNNFQGILLHRSGDAMNSFRVTHRYKNGEARERLQTLTGDSRDVVRRGDKVICLVPPGQRMPAAALQDLPQSLVPQLDETQLARIQQNYTFSSLGEARVAGRRCEGVAITPRDPLRYGYEVWADQETRVPLKVTMKGPDGRSVEQLLFTEVRFPDTIDDAVFDITPQIDRGYESIIQERTLTPMDAALAPERAALEAGPQLALVSIPEGFEVVMFAERQLPGGAGTLRHWVISDGLTSVSIFGRQGIEQRRASMPSAQHALGATHAYRHITGSVEITVVGEVPLQTVRGIAEGTSRRLQRPDAANTAAPPPN
jgi:sigma-E factor negative regulatory protein RseB